jgi:hypothetical protein
MGFLDSLGEELSSPSSGGFLGAMFQGIASAAATAGKGLYAQHISQIEEDRQRALQQAKQALDLDTTQKTMDMQDVKANKLREARAAAIEAKTREVEEQMQVDKLNGLYGEGSNLKRGDAPAEELAGVPLNEKERLKAGVMAARATGYDDQGGVSLLNHAESVDARRENQTNLAQDRKDRLAESQRQADMRHQEHQERMAGIRAAAAQRSEGKKGSRLSPEIEAQVDLIAKQAAPLEKAILRREAEIGGVMGDQKTVDKYEQDIANDRQKLNTLYARAESLITGKTSEASTDFPSPGPVNIQKLIANPDRSADFDKLYGPGAASRFLPKTGEASLDPARFSKTNKAPDTPSTRVNPLTGERLDKAQWEKKFGKGSFNE